MQPSDDFVQGRQPLADLSKEGLMERFWALAAQAAAPLVERSRTHTTPATERSVLMRMGFSSLEARAIVERVSTAKLLGKGAGHVVLRLARALGLEYREAGRLLGEGQYLNRLPHLFTVRREAHMHD